MSVVLKAENISKQYRLGLVGTGSLSHDLNRWWHLVRGKGDPYVKIGAVNDRSQKADEDYVWALQNINFEVKEGEVLGIIGKNGAGKSTLLKLLSRVTSPTTGTIKTKGRIASLLEVGTGFHPELTGKENIYLNGAILGMTKAEIKEKEEEIIAFSGCEKYIDTPVKRYSSGMRVRLAFAVAAHLEPDILVVDEVLAVGDAEFQKKAIGKMKDISAGEGRTVLFVSHNMGAVKNLCTRGLVLEHGQIIFQGTQNESVDFYLSQSTNMQKTPLRERTDREGNQKLTIQHIHFWDAHRKPVHELYAGDECTIVFEYKKSEPIDLRQLTMVVQFRNEEDEIVCTIATDEMGVTFEELYDQGQIIINIPKLTFRQGEYAITFMISEKFAQKSKHKVIDYVYNAQYMVVGQSDYWNTGFFLRPKGFVQEACFQVFPTKAARK